MVPSYNEEMLNIHQIYISFCFDHSGYGYNSHNSDD